MKVIDKKTGEKIIILPSNANRDIGAFLIFIGVFAVHPSTGSISILPAGIFTGGAAGSPAFS